MPHAAPIPISSHRNKLLRLGYLALTDAAPLIVAQEQGFFARHGLQVELRREVGWATIREKIAFGELDAAQAPAPMLWSASLGLGGPACEVLTALVLNLHGNALTLSRALLEAGVRDAVSLREFVRVRRNRGPLTFGIVFGFSSHHLFLRDWLRNAGLEPERDVRIVVVPPSQLVRCLATGALDGFCAGEPWNTLAVRAGAGWCPAWSSAQNPGHVGKVLLVARRFAETRSAEHAALVRALSDAAAWCDEPRHREGLADLLAEGRFLNLPVNVIAPALLGQFDAGLGRTETVPDFHIFHRGDAGLPDVAKAAALQHALIAAGLLAASASPELPRRLFREDLYREILRPQLRPHAVA
jgi:ABC-type nitrate/sulfonate/bicarbonate transport system substrate-binding protein